MSATREINFTLEMQLAMLRISQLEKQCDVLAKEVDRQRKELAQWKPEHVSLDTKLSHGDLELITPDRPA